MQKVKEGADFYVSEARMKKILLNSFDWDNIGEWAIKGLNNIR